MTSCVVQERERDLHHQLTSTVLEQGSVCPLVTQRGLGDDQSSVLTHQVSRDEGEIAQVDFQVALLSLFQLVAALLLQFKFLIFTLIHHNLLILQWNLLTLWDQLFYPLYRGCPLSEVISMECVQEYFRLVLSREVCPLSECPLSEVSL